VRRAGRRDRRAGPRRGVPVSVRPELMRCYRGRRARQPPAYPPRRGPLLGRPPRRGDLAVEFARPRRLLTAPPELSPARARGAPS
jgi:hypothetical protein